MPRQSELRTQTCMSKTRLYRILLKLMLHRKATFHTSNKEIAIYHAYAFQSSSNCSKIHHLPIQNPCYLLKNLQTTEGIMPEQRPGIVIHTIFC